MDPIVIVLTTAVGALIGTCTGVLVLRRKLRPPVSDAEFDELKNKLRASESALDDASGKLEALRKQIDQQEKNLTQNAAELKMKQEQLDAELAETKKEQALRAAAERSAQELSAKGALLTEQCAKLEARSQEEAKLAAERTTRLTAMEAELKSATARVQELTDQAARLSSESEEHKRSFQQETRLRTALEAQLNQDQERIRQLTSEVAELQSERLQLEIKLQEERGSAAKGMELLVAAQEKLSSVFKALNTDVRNGHPGPAPEERAQANPGVKAEDEKAEATSASG